MVPSESDSDLADQLLEAFLNNQAELIAPDLIMVEVANTLWKRAVRKDVSDIEATAVYNDLLAMPLPMVDSSALAGKALALSLKHHHPVYDLVYCALAIHRDCELVTADRALVNKLGDVFPFVRHISSIRL
jgi:predicted nucleic acid-binding protein